MLPAAWTSLCLFGSSVYPCSAQKELTELSTNPVASDEISLWILTQRVSHSLGPLTLNFDLLTNHSHPQKRIFLIFHYGFL